MDPRGRIAIVTGAGSGIGRASALLLAARGATVVLADLDAAAAGAVAVEIESRGGKATPLELDVSRPEQIERAIAAVVVEHGGLHILHNCAGLVSGAPDFPDSSPARIAAVVWVNVAGTFVATRLAIDAISRCGGGGAIVNMSSLLALAAETADPVYAATKAAVKRFTELSAPIAARRGVRINAVLPGGVDTPILAKTGDGRPADWLVPRLGQIQLLAAEQVAATVLALIEDDRRNGETVVVRNRPVAAPARSG